jgi:DNA-binding HxlR family transcriptional regulator
MIANIAYWFERHQRTSMPAKRRKRSIADYSPTTTDGYTICAAVESARRIGNQWRLIVIRYLLEHPMRFNELLKIACDIDPKTLSRVLKYLTKEQIVQREVLGTQPFSVRYALTEKGEQVRPIMQSLKAWGEIWVLPEISASQSPYPRTS